MKQRKFKTAKKILKHAFSPYTVVVVTFLAGLLLIFGQFEVVHLFAQFSQEKGVDVKAIVGTTTLSITGYHSPYASIILKTSDGVFLASTTADSKGYFSLSNVLINSTNLTYCFEAVDFKRIGVSESCITIPGPIIGNVTYSDVFLPPSIALSKKQINAGQDAVIFGYSMPNATVKITIQGKTVTVTADPSGFYSYTYKNVPAGKFSITASATLNQKDSLAPTNEVTLVALSVPQQITNTGQKVIEKVKEKVPFNLMPFLLTALALLIAIGILLYKLKFRPWMIAVDFMRRRKKMHHDWFLDKW